jgi:hypothetical protein
MFHRAVISTVGAEIALVLAQASAARYDDTRRIALTPIGTFDAGGAGSAEIVAFDAGSKRLVERRHSRKAVSEGQLQKSSLRSFASFHSPNRLDGPRGSVVPRMATRWS